MESGVEWESAATMPRGCIAGQFGVNAAPRQGTGNAVPLAAAPHVLYRAAKFPSKIEARGALENEP
jgi:hypothetical protein